jgi:hypothetical protein
VIINKKERSLQLSSCVKEEKEKERKRKGKREEGRGRRRSGSTHSFCNSYSSSLTSDKTPEY